MINIGEIIIAMALSVLSFQALSPILLKEEKNFFDQKKLTIISSVLICISFFWLEYKYIISDFTILNVFENSNTLKPMFYKISGVWSNHEGSMLLFLCLLCLYSLFFALYSKSEFKSGILHIQACVSSLIMAYIYFVSNPFEASPKMMDGNYPSQGMGLNPLLQDVGLATHPPILYAGYAGFSIVFAYGVLVCRNNIPARTWSELVKPWVLFPWSLITIGVMLGSWWAYRELGWGGFWFWDPVENISLMPWLTGCALLHSLLYTRKFGGLNRISVLLALMVFVLSLAGFFLVRSGILSSVHSFANAPERGIAMLIIVFLVSGYSALIFGKSYEKLKPPIEENYSALSRQALVVANVVLISSMAFTLFIGIIYPIILDVLNLSQISVGEPYFNQTYIPITIALLFIMIFTPFIKWQNEKLINVLKKSAISLFLSLAITAIIFYFTIDKFNIRASLAMFAGLWLIISLVEILSVRFLKGEKISRGFFAMGVAHIGFGALCVAISLLTSLEVERTFTLKEKQTYKTDGYKITLDKSEIIKGENYFAQKADFTIKSKDELFKLSPENHVYMPSFSKTQESDIKSFFDKDFYLVMGESEQVESKLGEKNEKPEYIFPIKLYIKPFISFLWVSAVVIALGGLIAMTAKKK